MGRAGVYAESHSLATTTTVIDPIGELMEKLVAYMRNEPTAKLVQRDGNNGLGLVEINHANYVHKTMRDSGKHIVIMAHVQRRERNDGRVIKRANGSHKTI